MNKDKPGSIAIFGGSFDPIHLGHLHLAELIREEFDLDEVIFMPLGQPPHKTLSSNISSDQRFEMVELATNSNTYFKASRLEIDRAGYTYTAHTLGEVRESLSPGTTLYFIIGADSLTQMHNWKTPEQLFRLCEIIAISRQGIDDEKISSAMTALADEFGAKIHLINKPTYPISSTDIRNRIKAGLSINYFVPSAVLEYINKNRLYQLMPDLSEVKEYLKNNLSGERYTHSLRTANAAKKLAKIHDVDEERAYLAGLLHDIAKEIPLCDMHKYVDKSHEMYCYPPVVHSFIGAYVAKELFNIYDYDILNSISYHTTGRPNMSALEKIIYIADKIEDGRNYPESTYLKTLAEDDLDKALFTIVQIITSLAADKGKNIHPLSLEVLNNTTKEGVYLNESILKVIWKAIDDKFGADTVFLDVSKITTMTDYFVITTGQNINQMQAIVSNVGDELLKAGVKLLHLEGNSSSWVLMDFGHIIIHVFDKEFREFYDLERLWADAVRISV